MPGSSLWLLPPSTHPLSTILPTLIDKTSTHFSSPHRFIPHVTLTSEIDPSTYSPNPQQWLDSLPFPSASSATVKFGRLRSEDVFVRKLYIGVEKAGVKQIGKVTRQRVKGFEGEVEAERWAKEKYGPHLSLL
ncbi:2, 3 cyclic phosphodiesterase [Aaosphaeria arxii CBS 175.79]|uniref:2, 3 cyclic phosphodiesterase n=1 Tax=Aaosphaeria arxii CBS 175.79 TaxID=1450172 RepID=A0A6A5XZU6_9PLEO|nr:2, 3 cyclic phosphodiesterase [Aaosphaeria arxii CBS 175.79]KAF2018732.1 2, 3 cyclic phosphodiesterase [Aaosphaeria arxii CBS 175.79]